MANNPALQNAALSGGASVATGRWLASGAQADYVDIRNQLLLFAVAVDAVIAPTNISADDAELMAQICASVLSERWPTSSANFAPIASAIAAMWTAIRASLLPVTPAAAAGTRISWQEDFEYAGGGTIATSQVAITLGGLTNWRAISTGATGTAQPLTPMAEAGHPGILAMITNGAAANRAIHIYRGGNIVGQGFTFANQFQQAEFITRLPSIASVAIMIGMTNNVRGSQTAQMALLYSSAVSANWQLACSKAGVGTTTRDTGIAADTSFHRFKIAQDVLGTVTLGIDGSTVATISDANVPTTDILDYGFGLETLAVATKQLDIDWCSYLSQDLGLRSP